MNLFLKQSVCNKVHPLESTHLGHPELGPNIYQLALVFKKPLAHVGFFTISLRSSLSASFSIEHRTSPPKFVNNYRRRDLYQRSIAFTLREFFSLLNSGPLEDHTEMKYIQCAMKGTTRAKGGGEYEFFL